MVPWSHDCRPHPFPFPLSHQHKQVITFIWCLVGHAVILLLSIYWLKVLTRKGLQQMLVFVYRPKRKGYTFGADMGRSTATKHEPTKNAQMASQRTNGHHQNGANGGHNGNKKQQ